MKWLLLALALLLSSPALAQGCGPTNPNCIVPTRPLGDSTNAAASTAFVQSAIGIGSAINPYVQNHTIDATDCKATVVFINNPWTAALPAPLAAGCAIQICNGDPNDNTHTATRLSGFPAGVKIRLYMGQCVGVKSSGSTWYTTYTPGRFQPNFQVVLYVDRNGSNGNSGLLSNAAGNALLDANYCGTVLNTEYDLGGGQPKCELTAGQTFPNGIAIVGPMVNTAALFFEGNGGNATVQVAPGGTSVMFLADFAPYVITTNVTWDCTGGSAGCIMWSFHQQGGADLNAGTVLKGAAVGHVGVNCDTKCRINAPGITLTGTFSEGFILNEGSSAAIQNVSLADGTAIGTNLLQINSGSLLQWAGTLHLGTGATVGVDAFAVIGGGSFACIASMAVTGTGTVTRKYSALNNGTLISIPGAATLPGTNAGVSSATGYASGVTATSATGC